jgi:hypothetical protein
VRVPVVICDDRTSSAGGDYAELGSPPAVIAPIDPSNCLTGRRRLWSLRPQALSERPRIFAPASPGIRRHGTSRARRGALYLPGCRRYLPFLEGTRGPPHRAEPRGRGAVPPERFCTSAHPGTSPGRTSASAPEQLAKELGDRWGDGKVRPDEFGCGGRLEVQRSPVFSRVLVFAVGGPGIVPGGRTGGGWLHGAHCTTRPASSTRIASTRNVSMFEQQSFVGHGPVVDLEVFFEVVEQRVFECGRCERLLVSS